MLQPNHQNPRRVRASFFLPDFICNSSSADHQNERISIFMEYPSGPSDAPHRLILTMYIFWFLSNRQPFLCQNHLPWHVSKNSVNTTNAGELFNLSHSSLRVTIERAFGALKNRFRILDNKPFHPYKHTGEACPSLLHPAQLDPRLWGRWSCA